MKGTKSGIVEGGCRIVEGKDRVSGGREDMNWTKSQKKYSDRTTGNTTQSDCTFLHFYRVVNFIFIGWFITGRGGTRSTSSRDYEPR